MKNKDISEIYVSTTFARDGSKISDVLKSLNSIGILNLELGSNHCYEDLIDISSDFLKFNTLVHNYFPIPKHPFVINIASSDLEIRSKSIGHVMKALEFCLESKSTLYTFHPGFLQDPLGTGRSPQNYDFNWGDMQSDFCENLYQKSFDFMVDSLNLIIERARLLGVEIAIETEGSYRKAENLLMQRPEEFEKLFALFTKKDLGINLNIGHLPLASRYFNFKINDFVDLVADRIVAFELSHNDGYDDQHLPLVDNAWYWEIILDKRFSGIKKILEFRETDISIVRDNYSLCKQKILQSFQT